METSFKTIFTEMESTYGLMEEFTMVNGSIIKWKAKVLSRGVTEESIPVNMLTIRKTKTASM